MDGVKGAGNLLSVAPREPTKKADFLSWPAHDRDDGKTAMSARARGVGSLADQAL
jgi:hypothetical protein